MNSFHNDAQKFLFANLQRMSAMLVQVYFCRGVTDRLSVDFKAPPFDDSFGFRRGGHLLQFKQQPVPSFDTGRGNREKLRMRDQSLPSGGLKLSVKILNRYFQEF